MKIMLLGIGKSKYQCFIDSERLFADRLKHYCNFEMNYLEVHKSKNKLPSPELKKHEAQLILNKLNASDYLVLLDEKGKDFTSRQFATKIESFQSRSIPRLVFLIGGAFGFDSSIYDRANEKISLSKMTYSHQLIRTIFLEQIYRAYTIINNQSYHND